MRGVPGDAVCGPSPKAGSLRLSRRHFLFQGDDFGAGDLDPGELVVRHAVQLLLREVHVLMQVLVLLGSRQSKMLYYEFQRLEFVCPARRNPRLIGERLQVSVDDGRGSRRASLIF